MFYHIIIELKEKDNKNNNKRLYELDITDREGLISDYIFPYLNDEQFHVAGRYLIERDIVSLIIRESNEKSSVIQKILQSTVSRNVFFLYTNEDAVHSDEHTTDITKAISKEVKEQLSNTQKVTTADNSIDKKTDNSINKKKVFVVHGHDEAVTSNVARFLEKMDLEAIILREQPSGGLTIIEKLEKYSDVGFGVVLYTPCDIGAKQGEDKYLPRARQNVVFEHGYLIGKLTRENVCALVKDGIERPNDMSGVVYIPFDEYDGWQPKLAKELKNAGYDIDMNKLC